MTCSKVIYNIIIQVTRNVQVKSIRKIKWTFVGLQNVVLDFSCSIACSKIICNVNCVLYWTGWNIKYYNNEIKQICGKYLIVLYFFVSLYFQIDFK